MTFFKLLWCAIVGHHRYTNAHLHPGIPPFYIEWASTIDKPGAILNIEFCPRCGMLYGDSST